MLDIKTIREKTDWVCARLAARNAGDESKVREILALDEVRRKNLAESERLKSIRNKVSKEIGMLMGKKLLEEANAKKKVFFETINFRQSQLFLCSFSLAESALWSYLSLPK